MTGTAPILESMPTMNLISLFLKNFLKPGVFWALAAALLIGVSAAAQSAPASAPAKATIGNLVVDLFDSSGKAAAVELTTEFERKAAAAVMEITACQGVTSTIANGFCPSASVVRRAADWSPCSGASVIKRLLPAMSRSSAASNSAFESTRTIPAPDPPTIPIRSPA